MRVQNLIDCIDSACDCGLVASLVCFGQTGSKKMIGSHVLHLKGLCLQEPDESGT